MNKPFNSEIVKLCAEHSDEAAARMSAWKWDWLRRQKVEEISKDDIQSNDSCGFCARIESKGDRTKYDVCAKKCQLALAGQHCSDSGSYYRKASNAHAKQDQQAFTTAANDLYFQIQSIIDDFYKKPEPKKGEVFYKKSQRFRQSGKGTEEWIMSYVGGMCLVSLKSGQYWVQPITVQDHFRITEAEFKQICDGDTFTLIPDKK